MKVRILLFAARRTSAEQLAVFAVRRLPDSLGPYEFRYERFACALKNSQLIRPLPDAVTTICETVH
jgi:hypothetical protein